MSEDKQDRLRESRRILWLTLQAVQPWIYRMGAKHIPHDDGPESTEWQALLMRIGDALAESEG